MSDLRYDPVTGVWVAIARNRLERPMEFVPLEQVQKQIICPFCAGNEDETPATVIGFDAGGQEIGDGERGWVARVVPNKFPSLAVPAPESNGQPGPFRLLTVDGIQEIIIPSPRHVASLSELTDTEVEVLMVACQNRLQQVGNGQVKHVMLFMNCRLAAGASLGHIHLQLMASPVCSDYLQRRMAADRQHRAAAGEPLMRSLLEWELSQQLRVVKETEHFVIVCPYASRYAFQTWVIPRNVSRTFSEMGGGPRSELGFLCREIVTDLEILLDHPAYNLLLHQAPVQSLSDDYWYLEIFPRITRSAGFELGTDIWVNPVAPETAARQLKAAGAGERS